MASHSAAPGLAEQWSPLDLAEGFHLAQLFSALDRIGVVDAMTRPRASSTLARRFRLNADLLENGLQLLSFRTNLVRATAGGYVLTAECDGRARFLVRQYLGAYRRVADLDEVLRGRSSGAVLVDEKEHARAFAALRGKRATFVGNVVRTLGLNHVLDLGCGVGGLLLEASGRRRGFVGWGVDNNPHMCRLARRAVAQTRSAKITIYRGDCRRLNDVLPARVFPQVELVTAANVANEFCRDGGTGVVRWLRHLKDVLPGRLCLIADYYGRLGKKGMPGPRHALLHDWVQVISGQGVPPARLADWKRLYTSADCALQYEAEFDDGAYFVHLLQL